MAQFSFNAREVEPDQGSIGAIPAGWYKTMVTKTELKPNNDGTGMLIAAQIQVVEGAYKGTTIFANFNVQNPSEKATEIGRKQLSALCHAVNVLDMTDTDQLKNIPFFTRFKLTPAVMDENEPTKVKYQEKNEPNAYRNINDQAAISKAAETAAATSKPAQGAPAARPQAIPPQPPAQQMSPMQQQYAPPPMQAPQAQQQFQAPPAQQFQAPPQAQFQAPPQPPVQQQPQQAPAGMPSWAAAPEQPWGAPPQAPQQQVAAPQASPEQQAQYQQTMQVSPPWGAQ